MKETIKLRVNFFIRRYQNLINSCVLVFYHRFIPFLVWNCVYCSYFWTIFSLKSTEHENKKKHIAALLLLSPYMSSNGYANLLLPMPTSRGFSKQYPFLSILNDGVHVMVTMEPSLRYFQINTIQWSAVYGNHPK